MPIAELSNISLSLGMLLGIITMFGGIIYRYKVGQGSNLQTWRVDDGSFLAWDIDQDLK